MKLAGPGAPLTSLCSLTTVTSFLAVLVNIAMVGTTSGQHHHDIRHSRHYLKHPPHRFHDFDYEDATVVLKPEFLNTESNISVRIGDSATLPCAVRNLGTKEVVWRLYPKNAEPLVLTVGTFTWVRGNDIQVEYKMEEGFITRWDLVMRNVQMEDEGTYECQVTDKVPIRTHVHLTVKPMPASNPSVVLTGEEFVDSNERIKLVCNATGGDKIPEDIDWFKDGTKLDSTKSRDPKIVLTKYMSIEDVALISELTIEHAGFSDSGNYICRSSDRKIDSLKVTVLVAPNNPNVKRGTGAQVEEQKDDNGGVSMTSSGVIALLLSSVVATVISRTLPGLS
ncbi:zwei Ig domain protein zig-8 [Aplysia californica]|uniref:Zwei Ig domain protein zig-8 n=1 Tax=Aplysia californica TaxID=6500 RepID=A0ABM0JSX9_APLCA|nr:zwei Ig domain protein zig-8 [Aplysia californica]XP_012939286.1 zwei Ig domain protein zig-8 [Aplysia californica]XP_035826244.1 zwei Ig domain protein zig-8 [Aplysia californica]XP_035826245.1 zwei Ig domain protein zig-8 [Aplysia californica]XP_035826246.1 zwei Ig domain protein zig-8 [Aplysia californica]XP_035826247.1 zwei Ig domain protein zig-8 [Aplysia californica]XP_035826248.1 zwei Ig domain protein zig-8 [Aplysia californica]XP_035826249.1 zwei Ig domain protein zig-8 [Aplysia 